MLSTSPVVSVLIGFQENCADCGAAVGEFHDQRCDVAECAVTGLQRYGVCGPAGCGHEAGTDCLTRWTGTPASLISCQELGWYCLAEPGLGYPPCEPGTPGAMEDVRRLFVEAVWDRVARRWRKPSDRA